MLAFFSDFVEVFNAYYGRCFQFNSHGILKSSRAGVLKGLRVLMKTEQSEYLPWIKSMGAVITISTFVSFMNNFNVIFILYNCV